MPPLLCFRRNARPCVGLFLLPLRKPLSQFTSCPARVSSHPSRVDVRRPLLSNMAAPRRGLFPDIQRCGTPGRPPRSGRCPCGLRFGCCRGGSGIAMHLSQLPRPPPDTAAGDGTSKQPCWDRAVAGGESKAGERLVTIDYPVALSTLRYFRKQDKHTGFAILVPCSLPQAWQCFSSNSSFLNLAQLR